MLARPYAKIVRIDSFRGRCQNFDFSEYNNKIHVVTGGFPCQAFSYAGKRLGLEDARGTLFYEFARVVKEVNPPICIGENVRGLLSHDNGKTLQGMISILDEIGYNVVPVEVLKAIHYKVLKSGNALSWLEYEKILI